MKRTYLAKRNALFSSTNFSWGAYALILAISVLLLRLLAPNLFWNIFTPIFHASDSLALKSHMFFNSFGNIAELALQNEKLVNENVALANENKALIQKFSSIDGLTADNKGIIAGVVARPPESPYDILVISAGSDEGVTEGMEAFGAGGVPLGIVSSVTVDFSRITLFSSPGMATGGWVGETSLPIIINGAGAGTINASVPRSADLVVGDVVFVPGPGMLPIGIVSRVDSDPASPSVVLRITPAINLFSTTWVAVRDTGMILP